MKPFALLTDEELLRIARDAAAMPDAPESVIQAAIALWPEARPASLGALAGGLLAEGIRRLRAVLDVDSARPQSLAGGLRSMPSSTRHLLFSVDGCDVDLRIVASAAGHAISGQVLGPEEGGRIEVRAIDAAPGTDSIAQAELDALGEFRLDAVPGAGCAITLHLPAMVIDLPDIVFDPAKE